MQRSRLRFASATILTATLWFASTIPGGNPVGAAPTAITAHGSAKQVYATDLPAGDRIALIDADGDTVATNVVNDLGGTLFRDVPPASGYTLKNLDAGVESAAVTVHSDQATPWNAGIYDQPIASEGYQYLTVRDGTQLAVNVHLPLAGGDGPYPTLIEYAGYGYADPAGPQSGLAMVANLMGFAVVDVNMRGTGCSGGAFDYFEMLQNLDAYDVIETIANQPWVANGSVGMFGLSYGGISQLFAAQLNPPHLAAIAPLSVIDATASTLYPGGILNTGFAMSWAQGRVSDAQPATATTGQKWAYKRIQNGDTICAANQALHPEAVDLLAKVHANAKYVPEIADPLDPVSFVDKIHTPVFLACQFQDEQTGGHCPELVRHFTGTRDKWFTFTNGTHIDALDPATFNHLFDFLQLFVAKQVPGANNGLTRLAAPIVYRTALGVGDDVTLTLPHDPVQDETTYDDALAAFRALPTVQVRFDNGAGTAPDGTKLAGAPYAGFGLGFDTLPVPEAQPRTWYLGPDGTLTDTPATDGAIDSYTSDAAALPPTDYTGNTGGGGLWALASKWGWNWRDNPADHAVSYLTEPLSTDAVVVGTGAVHLWVRSSTPDVDLQATISEVRPDGVESFVQGGWIRASARKLATDPDNIFKRPSTPDDPIPSFTEADSAPMPADEFVEVTIPLYYQGHAYRSGSRIRVTVAAPNGAQPVWSFAETRPADDTARVEIGRSPGMRSGLILPVIDDVAIPTELPACPSLRSEPCRPFTSFVNTSSVLPPGDDPTVTTTVTTTTTTTMPSTMTTVPTDPTTPPNTSTTSSTAPGTTATTMPHPTTPSTTRPGSSSTTTGPSTTVHPSTTTPHRPTTTPTTARPVSTTDRPRPGSRPSHHAPAATAVTGRPAYTG